ncbi:hypothetical protein BDN70DRAFT_878855 [Pholiota conissans]|uniref:Uncharacterized protein n=1 Tax=Pholiota conissans TaxID=109636 RepID=A0A9P5Z4M1_9AGAR|nr:hypothetical protein BDN70DRAFT_878855 [Pholiota conissans]
MIIPEETAKPPIVEQRDVQQQPPTPSVSTTHYTPLQDESPPAYYGSTSQPTYAVPQPYYVDQRTDVSYRYGRSPTARFMIALSIAWIVSTLIAALIRSFAMVIWRWPGDWDGGRGPGGSDPHFEFDIPSGIGLSECIQGSAWTSNLIENDTRKDLNTGAAAPAQAAFDLSLKDAKLFLITRGQLSFGALDVITSPTQPSNTVTIVVEFLYAHPEVRNLAMACKLTRQFGQTAEGVGIFTPKWRNGHREREETVSFVTTVIFPEVAAGNEPLFVRGFETDVPNFRHRIADLESRIQFGSMTLKGSNEPMEIKSLSASTAELQSKNGYIRGLFNVTSSLVLETTNNLIEVAVTLHSAHGSKPACQVRTTNGPTEAVITLTSDSSFVGSSYTISTTTSNSDALIQIPSQPLNSNLYLTTTTTNGPAHVSLNEAFEGGLLLESPGAIVIKEDKAVEDPSGAGRKRNVVYSSKKRQGKQVLTGSVLWGPEKSRRGSPSGHGDGLVTIRNSNAPLTLEL